MNVLYVLFIGLALAQDEAVFDAIEEPPMGAPLTAADEIASETTRVASLLRCPACQGLSVAESREGLSLAMKDRIQELVQAGYTDEQIIDYFAERYGESIVLLPDEKHRLVWLGPVALALLGLGIVGWQISRNMSSAPVSQPTTGPGPSAADDDYRRRVLEELEQA